MDKLDDPEHGADVPPLWTREGICFRCCDIDGDGKVTCCEQFVCCTACLYGLGFCIAANCVVRTFCCCCIRSDASKKKVEPSSAPAAAGSEAAAGAPQAEEMER